MDRYPIDKIYFILSEADWFVFKLMLNFDKLYDIDLTPIHNYSITEYQKLKNRFEELWKYYEFSYSLSKKLIACIKYNNLELFHYCNNVQVKKKNSKLKRKIWEWKKFYKYDFDYKDWINMMIQAINNTHISSVIKLIEIAKIKKKHIYHNIYNFTQKYIKLFQNAIIQTNWNGLIILDKLLNFYVNDEFWRKKFSNFPSNTYTDINIIRINALKMGNLLVEKIFAKYFFRYVSLSDDDIIYILTQPTIKTTSMLTHILKYSLNLYILENILLLYATNNMTDHILILDSYNKILWDSYYLITKIILLKMMDNEYIDPALLDWYKNSKNKPCVYSFLNNVQIISIINQSSKDIAKADRFYHSIYNLFQIIPYDFYFVTNYPYWFVEMIKNKNAG